MGVWIETFESVGRGTVIIVTPCMGVWIETLMSAFVRYFSRSHTLYGCVDWNKPTGKDAAESFRHTLYGCVDWNKLARRLYPISVVTPCMGVWIETPEWWKLTITTQKSHPVWVCGLKLEGNNYDFDTLCHTLRGCVDWNITLII